MKRVALLVGVDEYRDPDILTLEFAVQDVVELAGWLRHVAGYEVRILTGPHAQSNKILEEVRELVHELASGDLFLFYFAGHGYHHMGYHLLLCPDAALDSLDYFQNTVPVDLLRRRTEKPGLRRAFVLDACRRPLRRGRGTAGGIRGTQTVRDILAEYRVPAGGGLAVLCSCADDQQAVEVAGLRHGLFSYALLEELRTAKSVGRQVRVDDELRLALQSRMNQLAQQYGQPTDQEPQSDCRGEVPVLLSGGAPESAQDPARVKVEEASIPAVKITLEHFRAEQVEVPGLPPIAEDTLELEGRAIMLEQTIQLIESGKHPDLAPAQEAVHKMEEQWLNLSRDLEANTPALAPAVRQSIQDQALKGANVSVAQLCSLAPGVSATVLVPYAQRLKNTAMARAAFERAHQAYRQVCETELSRLRTERAAVKSALQRSKEEDFTVAVDAFLEQSGEPLVFPLEAWNSLQPVLCRRRYPWSDSEMLERARRLFAERPDRQAWRTAQAARTAAAVQGYLVAWPQGVYRREAEALLAELAEESAWSAVADTADAAELARFLSAYPTGRFAAQAMERLRELQTRAQQEAETRQAAKERRAARQRLLAFSLLAIVISFTALFFAVEGQQRRADHELWERMHNENTKKGYLYYASQFPNGRHLDEAKKAVEQIEDEEEWQSVLAKQTLDAYRKYLSERPNGRHAPEARRVIELAEKEDSEDGVWEEANLAETVEGYDGYLARFPSGRYRSEAERAIQRIKSDDAAFATARIQHTAAAYQSYLDNFPEGRKRSEAQAAMVRMKGDDQAFAKAREQNTPAAYQSYLDDFPEGRNRSEAQAAIERMKRDDEAWVNAREQYTLAACEAYLDEFPQGRHRNEAEQVIDRIRRDDAAWAEAQGQDTIAAHNNYVQNWSDGRHLSEAREAIRRIQSDDGAWQLTKEVGSERALKRYLETWPQGHHVEEADRLLSGIRSLTTNAWHNSLGMKFVPVVGTRVLVSIWETRVRDYAAFAKENRRMDGSWRNPVWNRLPLYSNLDCPVVNVSWEDANAFCQWLTRKERREHLLKGQEEYRLLTDAEWSIAVGLQEQPTATPISKNLMVRERYSWGIGWPPPWAEGNYADMSLMRRLGDKADKVIEQYDDGHPTLSPVGTFGANRCGLCDLIGNVWEWCEDWLDPTKERTRVLRGGSWLSSDSVQLLPSYRNSYPPDRREMNFGFRCVLDRSRPSR